MASLFHFPFHQSKQGNSSQTTGFHTGGVAPLRLAGLITLFVQAQNGGKIFTWMKAPGFLQTRKGERTEDREELKIEASPFSSASCCLLSPGALPPWDAILSVSFPPPLPLASLPCHLISPCDPPSSSLPVNPLSLCDIIPPSDPFLPVIFSL